MRKSLSVKKKSSKLMTQLYYELSKILLEISDTRGAKKQTMTRCWVFSSHRTNLPLSKEKKN